MKGFEITYRTCDGKTDSTFFAMPECSAGLVVSLDAKDIVEMMFCLSYPERDIVDMKECTLKEFEAKA